MNTLQAMTDAIMWECGLTPRAEDLARNAARAALTALSENITVEMVEAGYAAYARKADDIWSMTPTEHPDDGGGAMGYALRAMLNQAMKEQG